MQLRRLERLDECFRVETGTVLITGLQALVRLLLMQRRLDERAGLKTAGFVSGYRGSPLGGLDRELWRAAPLLRAAHIHFEPGLNEELAATSVWGSQQSALFPDARYDGVFALWYGKGPGVDRSGDAFKHGNAAGTSAHGGVLAVAGDDHACKSSTLAHQSEYAFIDAMMPVLNPSDVHELLELGLMGYALSRYSGCWVGFKIIQETADATQTISFDPQQLRIVVPELQLPPDGLNIRWPDPPLEQEARLHRHKLSAALAFARANRLNRVVIDTSQPRLGIVTTGKAHLDTLQALDELGIGAKQASDIGIRLLKVGMAWPLEAEGLKRFAAGLEEILVIEEKRGLIESQVKELLYDGQVGRGPVVVGKCDERGEWLLPSSGELSTAQVARAIAARLRRFYQSSEMEQRLRFLESREEPQSSASAAPSRPPYFCSGCPHNTSTRVPEGSRAVAGIGCHYMAAWMDRSTITFTQMGGEGATWIGQAPFTETQHVFQNIGDGTYAHSGILAIRAAVAAKVNITYKILFNHAVAMTGGQPVEGELTVQQVAQQLIAEGVHPVVVVSDDPGKHELGRGMPAGVLVHHRRELDRLQRELRDQRGVSVLIFDQACATELHRLRKRRLAETPDRRVVINELVCEGCGDCNEQSNCLSVVPLETEFGRKRAINQSSCNMDFSCLQGFCPSFVTIRRGKAPAARTLDRDPLPSLPEPVPAPVHGIYNILVAGVGGTGVVTASGLLGLAAHLEGKAVVELDQTGLAQKFGAVLSHVRVGVDEGVARMHAMRIPKGQVDLLLGIDLLVASGPEPLAMLDAERSAVVINAHPGMPPAFIRDKDLVLPVDALLAALESRSRAHAMHAFDATHLATTLLGDGIAANILMLGFAFQRGLLPMSSAALYRALELYGVDVGRNKLAFDWGRHAAQSPREVEHLASRGAPQAQASGDLSERINRRERFLIDYQDEAYARRYREAVERIRAAEHSVCAGSSALTEAVARGYFKLLAYKDEYEVARLHTRADFLERLREDYGSAARLSFHLSPPLIARRDPSTGRPKQLELGSWVLSVFRVLARLKGLRGTRMDPFSYTKERRMERRLIEDYERLLEKVVQELTPERLGIAVELASLPERIRGFGPVKQAAVAQAAAAEKALLERWSRADQISAERGRSAA